MRTRFITAATSLPAAGIIVALYAASIIWPGWPCTNAYCLALGLALTGWAMRALDAEACAAGIATAFINAAHAPVTEWHLTEPPDATPNHDLQLGNIE